MAFVRLEIVTHNATACGTKHDNVQLFLVLIFSQDQGGAEPSLSPVMVRMLMQQHAQRTNMQGKIKIYIFSAIMGAGDILVMFANLSSGEVF